MQHQGQKEEKKKNHLSICISINKKVNA